MAPPAPHVAIPRRRARQLDLLGILLVVVASGWTVWAATGRSGARPGPVVALALASLALAIAARAVDPGGRVVPGGVAVGVAGAVVLTLPGVLESGGGPTGYANANADLAALGVVAAAAAAALAPSVRERRAWAGLAAALVLVLVATGSVAAGAALALVAVLTATSVLRRTVAPLLLGGLIAAVLVLAGTAAISHGSELAGLRDRDELRAELWAAAADVAADHPLRGIGPGTYGELHLVSADPDLRWAHHEYLQTAAEVGLVGLGLLLAVVAWAYARLWWGRARRSTMTLAGAAALTVVALHACVDHVLHHAAVPLTAVVLVAWATGDRRGPGSQGSPRRRR